MFYYFTLWRQDGLDQRIQEILRCQVRERSRRVRRPATSPAPAWDASFTRDSSSNPDVADLDLLPVEVEQNGTVGEPRVVRDVPKQPGTCQSLPGQSRRWSSWVAVIAGRPRCQSGAYVSRLKSSIRALCRVSSRVRSPQDTRKRLPGADACQR